MADLPLTLMAVHAHPDDEALFTGGILAASADAGVATVLVTCTNGELGYGPGGSSPADAAHDEAAVTATRTAELAESCRILGIGQVERLGYRDSGMMGWPQNDDPGAFWNAPLDQVADRLSGLIRRYRPHVVVTYGADGFYGHPDHIKAHQATVAAVERSGIFVRVYFVAVARSKVAGFVEMAGAAGVVMPDWANGEAPFGTPDSEIDADVDCTAVVGRKLEALRAHASQVDNQFFVDLGPDLFAAVFGVESFVRGGRAPGGAGHQTDLFAGIDETAAGSAAGGRPLAQ